MPLAAKITETEWEIMRVVWARPRTSGTAIIAELQRQDPTWHPKTARTLLTRLVRKGALDSQIQGRVQIYTPLVTERECVLAASQSFLNRVFGGSLKPMLAFFAEQKKLTKKDLEELHALLDKPPTKPRRKK